MATTVLKNCKLYVGALNLSGDSNSLSLAYGAEMLDDTTFQEGASSGTRSFKPGLKTVEVTASLFWNTENDEAQFEQLAVEDEGISVAQLGETEGDRVFFTKGCRYTYNPLSGEVGQIISGSMAARAANDAGLVQGSLMARGTKTSTGNSTGLNLGSLTGRKLYSLIHVTAITGTGSPTLTGIIESDDNSGFTTPTTRVSHSAITAIGSSWAEVTLGAVTDAYWRAKWTITGTSPNFTINWSFGSLP